MEFLSPSFPLEHPRTGVMVLDPGHFPEGSPKEVGVSSAFSYLLTLIVANMDCHSLTTYSGYPCFTDDETETQKV